MQGLLADINLQGHLVYLHRLRVSLDLWPILEALNLRIATFPEIQLPQNTDDRSLWNYCQREQWVLFTDNRNQDDENALQTTLDDSWQVGHLPVLTLANKRKFESDMEYACRVTIDMAELLFGISEGEYRDQSRIFLPR